MSPMQGSKVGGDTCRIVEEGHSARDWTAACAYVIKEMQGKRMHLLRDESGTAVSWVQSRWRGGRVGRSLWSASGAGCERYVTRRRRRWEGGWRE
jgi:hypothetical protein